MNKQDEIIVSFTSWTKRVQYCKQTIELMLSQTIRPDRIILNLSTDEFPGQEKDLPKDLVNLIQIEKTCEIYWVKENTKVYKKVIHTLNRFPNSVIISIDDDIDYPNNLIEELYSTYIYYNKQYPVTSGTYKWDGLYTHYGCFSLITKNIIGDFYQDLYDNVVMKYGIDKCPFDDSLFTYSVYLNGKRYVYTKNLNMSAVRIASPRDKINRTSKLGTDEYKKINEEEHRLIREYIKNKYGLTYKELIKTPVHVNITTWAKRDMYLYDMLKNLQEQTLQPDKIILWLSHEEYDMNNLPKTILKCIDDKLLTDIEWVDRNTYCHKRFECFKKYSHCFNLMLDDDILYKPDFIKELIEFSNKHMDCVNVYSTYSVNYVGKKITILPAIIDHPSHKNIAMGGRICFPPFICPMEIFENTELRDIYVTKCDESWIRPILVKNNIKVASIHIWDKNHYNIIDGTREDSVYNENKRLIDGEMREKERNLYNSIKIHRAEKEYKQIFPKIDIDNYQIKKR